MLRPALRMASTGTPPVERGETSSSTCPSRAFATSGTVTTERPNEATSSFSSSTSAGVRCAPGSRFTWSWTGDPPSGSDATSASTAAA